MTKMIEITFKELKQAGIIRSGTDFSKNWLGMEGSYWRGCQTKNREPSVKAIARCAVKLRTIADKLSTDENPKIIAFRTKLRKLADGCVEQMLQGET
jgi:hypothetical protein